MNEESGNRPLWIRVKAHVMLLTDQTESDYDDQQDQQAKDLVVMQKIFLCNEFVKHRWPSLLSIRPVRYTRHHDDCTARRLAFIFVKKKKKVQPTYAVTVTVENGDD